MKFIQEFTAWASKASTNFNIHNYWNLEVLDSTLKIFNFATGSPSTPCYFWIINVSKTNWKSQQLEDMASEQTRTEQWSRLIYYWFVRKGWLVTNQKILRSMKLSSTSVKHREVEEDDWGNVRFASQSFFRLHISDQRSSDLPEDFSSLILSHQRVSGSRKWSRNTKCQGRVPSCAQTE